MDADPNSVTTSSLELAKIGQINTQTSESLKIRAQKNAAKKAEKRLRQKLETSEDAVEAPKVKNVVSMGQQPPPPLPHHHHDHHQEVKSTLTPLQQKMRAKLTGSQFRHINEKLYTTHSSEALTLFTDQPSLFHDVYPVLTLLTIVSSRIPTPSTVMAD